MKISPTSIFEQTQTVTKLFNLPSTIFQLTKLNKKKYNLDQIQFKKSNKCQSQHTRIKTHILANSRPDSNFKHSILQILIRREGGGGGGVTRRFSWIVDEKINLWKKGRGMLRRNCDQSKRSKKKRGEEKDQSQIMKRRRREYADRDWEKPLSDLKRVLYKRFHYGQRGCFNFQHSLSLSLLLYTWPWPNQAKNKHVIWKMLFEKRKKRNQLV